MDRVKKLLPPIPSLNSPEGRDLLKNWLVITLACGVFAFTVVLLVRPARLPASGVTGIALFLNYLWGVPLGVSNGVLNLLLFLYAFKVLSRRFLWWTIYATVLISIFYELAEVLPAPQISDQLLLVIVAGVLQGAASAMVFWAGGSTGGTDIVTVSVKRRTGMEVGSVAMAINFFIILAFCFIVPLEMVLYGLVMTYVSSLVTNSDLRAFGTRKEAMIISSQPEAVREFIIKELHRGVTIFHAVGGFNSAPHDVMITLLSPRQAIRLKRFLKRQDPNAFLRLSDVHEVLGRGFSNLKETV